MVAQLLIGSGLTILCVVVSGLSFWVSEVAIDRHRDRLRRLPRPLRLLAVAGATAVLVLAVLTFGVWTWTVAFLLLGLFPHFEEALYFGLVTYTTLGFGDILPPREWRILGAMAAANGFINIGLLTALLLEGLRAIREAERR